jgi:hypothetical protein
MGRSSPEGDIYHPLNLINRNKKPAVIKTAGFLLQRW